MMAETAGYARHEAATPGAADDFAARQQALKRDTNLRVQAIDRLRRMNVQHAMHAWQRRYSDPIAPYALAFLYAQPARPGWLAVRAATRLWLAGPEAADLPRLLFRLNEVVTHQRGGTPYDPRRDLADRVDPQMAADAWYVGLAVSSLDTHTGSWEQARERVNGYADLPGLVRIVMTDTTTITVDRRGLPEFNTMTVHTTHALSWSMIDAPYTYNVVPVDDLIADPDHRTVLRWMTELNDNLSRADHARSSQGTPSAGRGHDPRSRRRQP
ncbi:hypothetical protein O7627_33085 [Solwaraspora sp. WMMD1047]|uniref:hypothetical protein n=1 Tax=Solwaraspora sp. WMMD1047 TaxID=3016102 RepID=UPI002415F848|nr:hypothetical protein [Solwaraspora sp. WMMD1047]MDG4834100.1 hypothetical protein [Solwaraspora sp. WMMD1047]